MNQWILGDIGWVHAGVAPLGHPPVPPSKGERAEWFDVCQSRYWGIDWFHCTNRAGIVQEFFDTPPFLLRYLNSHIIFYNVYRHRKGMDQPG